MTGTGADDTFDWNDAYDNRAHIPDAQEYLDNWTTRAAAFRQEMLARGQMMADVAYGNAIREKTDIFHPGHASKGLVIYVHGGYWRALDKSFWSHLAAGPLAHGWSMAIPGYTLAPDIRVSGITAQITRAVSSLAESNKGKIRLVGHSAGGHLVTRMLCDDVELPENVAGRIEHTVSVSGLNDLRPLLRTAMNEDLKLDEDEAQRESPVFLKPRKDISLTCWVGAEERPEFLRQNDLLASHWSSAGIKTFVDPGKHHFSVVEALSKASSPLTAELMQAR